MAPKPKRIVVPRTRNAGTMTEAQYFGKIRSLLRKWSMYWIPLKNALQKARRPNQSANKRLTWEYQCACCKKWFPANKVEVDHIIPCGSLTSLDDVKPFIAQMTTENEDDYQVLCKETCHRGKTNTEAKIRRDAAKERATN